MRALRRRYHFCLCGAVLCAVAAVLFACASARHAVLLFAAAASVLACLTLRASSGYRAARLIAENPILRVGVASVTETGGGASENAVDVVVSGFGVLMDGKPYAFGHGGIELTSVCIDRERIALSFGGEERHCCVRLLHGVTDKAEIDKLCDRLRYETGVVADVSGW